MQIYRGAEPVDAHRGATAALGNFDGVHLGHRAVIAAAREAAPAAPLAVVSFEPHPRRVFAHDAPPFELMSPEAKAHAMAALGVEALHLLHFDAAMATMSPEGFCADILAARLGLSHVAVGADFRFGKDRAGDAEALAREGARLGFGVTTVPREIEASSSAIRKALSEGDAAAAAAMIGGWHRIEGPVLHGEKRGRDLGWPTANLGLCDLFRPRFGVYAVFAELFDGPHKGRYHGVASLGVRPMFGENAPNLETYLFDFSGEIYGAELSVSLVQWLRPELKFDSLDALVAQMARDGDAARAVLARATP